MNKKLLDASQVLSKYWKGACPIDPIEIAEKIGIEVLYDTSLSEKKISGRIDIENNKIYVNAEDVKLRQRFTVAHELGHYFSGHNSSNRVDPEYNMNLNVNSAEERQANNFAANLLMPEEFIRYFIFKKKITNINRLATLLNVSSIAMRFRLKNLGLI